QGGARRGVDLVAVVRFEHFDVVAAVEQLGRYVEQLERGVDAHAHVGGKDDGDLLAGGVNRLLSGFVKAGGANDAFDAQARANLQMVERTFRTGEVDEAVGIFERFEVVGDGDTGFAAKKSAGILADAG